MTCKGGGRTYLYTKGAHFCRDIATLLHLGKSFVKPNMRVVIKGRLFGDQPLTVHDDGTFDPMGTELRVVQLP